jgi:hypothetical protein
MTAVTAAERRRAYETAVRNLRGCAEKLAADGWAEEAIARELVSRRNELKRAARMHDDPQIVALMNARNLVRYGDPIGPTADQLLARYGSWRAVIDAACRHARLSGDVL